MSSVKKIGERITWSKNNDELVVVISSRLDRMKETLLLAWLIGWTLCGITVAYYLFNGGLNSEQKLFMWVYMFLWFYFEYRIFYVFLFRKWGYELLKAGNDNLKIKNELFKYGKVKTFDAENIKDIKLTDSETNSFNKTFFDSFWTITYKSLWFEYLTTHVEFGIQLNESDSKELRKLVLSHLRKKA